MTTTAVLVIIVGIIVVAAIAFFMLQRQRSDRLRQRFGPEYDRAVCESGSTRRAESQLHQREERVQKFNIRPLAPADRDRFLARWTQVQSRFVDDPRGAVIEADQLIAEVMSLRGYPIADFETSATDLSVDHPLVVEHYRAGHALAERQSRGQATTEDLRQAMVHYRTLFDDLLGAPAAARAARA
jgi:hypothetical protein